jgi:hypothetical protein
VDTGQSKDRKTTTVAFLPLRSRREVVLPAESVKETLAIFFPRFAVEGPSAVTGEPRANPAAAARSQVRWERRCMRDP